MNNSLQTAVNAVLVLAVAGLYFLHFSARPASSPGKMAAPAIATDKSVAVLASPKLGTTADPVAGESAEAVAPVAAPEAVGPATASSADDKIAYVESGKMLDGYQGMKDARKAFENKARGWERQNQNLVAGFKAAVEAYQKQAASLTAEQRAATEEKLQAQQQQVAQQQEKLQRQAQEEEGRLTQNVLGSVNKRVEAYGKAHGYKLILIAAPSGTIAYGRKDLDITTAVIAHLNAGYRKK